MCIRDSLRTLSVGTEPPVPYPQANDLDKVADLVPRVESELGTKADIADYFEFDERQGDYYANAGRYLGFLEREDGRYVVTDLGRQFVHTRSIAGKSRLLIEQLLTRPTFRAIFELLLQRNLELDAVSNEEIAAAIAQFTGLSGTTPGRRASTVRSWLRWLLENSEIVM